LKYTIVDAFTSSPFAGNPASVIVLPPSVALPDATLLKIAAEFNLSETAYLVPKGAADDDESSRTYGLRWFTPAVEAPICGHATLASSKVLFTNANLTPESVTTLRFETLSGVLTARRVPGGGQIELEFPAMECEAIAPSDDLFSCTSEVIKEAVGAGTAVNVREVLKAGIFLLVHVEGFDLEKAVVNADRMLKLPGAPAVIVTSGTSASYPEAKFISRMFAPSFGVPEDPVCGSAHCVLTPYWSQVLGIPPGEVIRARQVSRRGGDLELVWEKAKGTVKIRGEAAIVARGELYVG